jgi:hypothetical protein
VATYNKYKSYVKNLCDKKIDCYGTGNGTTADVFKAIIHTDAPVDADNVVGDLIEINTSGTVNGYAAGGLDILFVGAETATDSGIIEGDATDVVWTASGGNLGNSTSGRYFTVYSFTSALKHPMCSFDYSSTFTVASGETMTLDFGTTFWQLQ